ncbi:unnamed protein product, partial [Prunus brigantina]
METIFQWSGEPPKYDKEELCTLELHHFGMLENGVYKGGKVCYVDNCIHDYLSLLDFKKIGIDLGYKVDITQRVTSLKVYYKGPVKSGQHVVNEVVNDSCIPGEEEEENGNKEAASRAQLRNNAPNDEYAQCFEEMNEMPLNEATGEISDDDEDSDRLPSDIDSSGDVE